MTISTSSPVDEGAADPSDLAAPAPAEGEDAPSPETPRERVAFIHGLRGVAALLVVWAHLGTIWPNLYGLSSYSNDTLKQYVVDPFRIYQDGGHLGVLLFFLISGYIVTYTATREDRLSFSVKRLLRLGPPLAAAMLVTWGWMHLARQMGTEAFSVSGGGTAQWLRSLVLLDGWFGTRVLHLTWTLVVEIIFYALTFALLGLSRRRPETAMWAFTGIWAAFCVAAMTIPGLRTADNVILPPFVGWLIIGRCIYLGFAGRIRPVVAVLNALLSFIVFLAFTENLQPGLVFGSTSPVAEPLYTYAYALIIFLGLMAVAPARTVQPFTMLGDISYSLYLLHMPVGFLTFDITHRMGLPVDVMIWSAIGMSILAAWISYRLVELPSQRFARWMLRRRRASGGQTDGAERRLSHDRDGSPLVG